MAPIQIDNAQITAFSGYSGEGITITPDPQVGKTSTITISMQNVGTSPIVVRRIEPKLAQFGIGMTWTSLPTLDGLILPADRTTKEVSFEWTPTMSGHRCFRAFIQTTHSPQPLCVGRNLHIIKADVTQSHWQVPFHLGNPQEKPMPIYVTLHGAAQVEAQVLVQETLIQPGKPIWLRAGEEVSGMVLLRAKTSDAIEGCHVRVEGTVGGQFLDGLQVEVSRPACVSPSKEALTLIA
jgi:hypothetical protein